MNTRLESNKKYFILDMDGTFYLGNQLLEGSLEFLKKVEAAGKQFLFFTNNSSRNKQVYLKNYGMGCHIDESQLLTSGMVTIHYIKTHGRIQRSTLLGTPALEQEFESNGIQLTETRPDAVVVGFDTTLTYEKLESLHLDSQSYSLPGDPSG